jgi:RNA polymerase sigma-70 factor (ECF subfamily)
MVNDPHRNLPTMLPRLIAFAQTIIGNPDIARDLVQEAVTRALAAKRIPAEPAAYRTWLFRIVRNAGIDELRRMKTVQNAQPPVPVVDLWGFDDARIAKITVEQGLAGLEPAHREIIALIDIAGFSYSEVSELLDVPIGTVMSRIARARMALLGMIEASTLRPLKSRHGH